MGREHYQNPFLILTSWNDATISSNEPILSQSGYSNLLIRSSQNPLLSLPLFLFFSFSLSLSLHINYSSSLLPLSHPHPALPLSTFNQAGHSPDIPHAHTPRCHYMSIVSETRVHRRIDTRPKERRILVSIRRVIVGNEEELEAPRKREGKKMEKKRREKGREEAYAGPPSPFPRCHRFFFFIGCSGGVRDGG